MKKHTRVHVALPEQAHSHKPFAQPFFSSTVMVEQQFSDLASYLNNTSDRFGLMTFEGISIAPLSTESCYRHSNAKTHIVLFNRTARLQIMFLP